MDIVQMQSKCIEMSGTAATQLNKAAPSGAWQESYRSFTLAHILVQKLWALDGNEISTCLVCNGLGHSGSCRSLEGRTAEVLLAPPPGTA